MSRIDKLAPQFAWTVSGRFAAALVQAATMLLLARLLGPGRFGVVATALAIIVVLQSIIDMGISTFVIRERARNSASPDIRRALAISDRLSLALSTSLFVIVGSLFVAGVSAAAPITLLAVTAGADRNADCWLGVILADGEARYNSMILIGRRFVILAVYLVLNAANADPLWAYCAATAATAICASILARRLVIERIEPAGGLTLSELLRRTKHYWFNSLFIQIRNLDIFIVTALAGVVQAGYFSLASRVAGPVRMVPTSLATVLLPSAAKQQHNAQGYRQVVRLSAYVLGLSWVVYAVLISCMPLILTALAGPEYGPAALPLQIVIAGLCFASTVSILNALLTARDRPRLVARASGTSSFICLLLIAFMAPRYGALGAAIAVAFSYMLNLAIVGTASVKCKIFSAVADIKEVQAVDEAAQEGSTAK